MTENVPNWPRTGAGAAVRESELVLKSVFHNGDLDIVEILVEQGTDLKLKDEDGVTILEYAMEEGHKDIVRQRILKMLFRTNVWLIIIFQKNNSRKNGATRNTHEKIALLFKGVKLYAFSV